MSPTLAGHVDRRWTLGPLVVTASGTHRRVRHLVEEYGPGVDVDAMSDGADPHLAIRFGQVAGRPDRHRLTRWRVRTSAPEVARIRVDLELHGLFADALVQSVVTEQLLGLVATSAGRVMVPAAALTTPAGATVLLSGSARAGKSVVALAALAAGWTLLADDHVLLDARGTAQGLPRRMRLHPRSLALVPGSLDRLAPGEHRLLVARAALRRLSLGRVSLPILAAPERFGAVRPADASPLPLAAAAILSRETHLAAPSIEVLESPAMIAATIEQVARDRRRLTRTLGEAWASRLADVAAVESGLLRSAYQGLPSHHLRVPADAPPRTILDALADLGAGGRSAS